MIQFEVLQASRLSKARLGRLTTPHGVIETPAFVPVATQGVVKTLKSDEVVGTNSQVLIANTFHLHLKPGESIVRAARGLHSFMQWGRPLMTDSGGYQVFSLGFGRDMAVGKIAVRSSNDLVQKGQQPQDLRITDEGVWFRSPINGDKIFVGPKESMQIQEALGADIIFAFDECTPPAADKDYTRHSLSRTHHWAAVCLQARTTDQALYGIVQGGKWQDLRRESATYLSSLPFDGFGIGGEFGSDKQTMTDMLAIVVQHLPDTKPRHVLGIGHLADIPEVIKAGADTFDCIVPTHYARRGIAFTSQGKMNLEKPNFLKEFTPLDPACSCTVCQQYTRAYLCHLYRAREITALALLTFHNLFYFNQYVAQLREEIKAGNL